MKRKKCDFYAKAFALGKHEKDKGSRPVRHGDAIQEKESELYAMRKLRREDGKKETKAVRRSQTVQDGKTPGKAAASFVQQLHARADKSENKGGVKCAAEEIMLLMNIWKW